MIVTASDWSPGKQPTEARPSDPPGGLIRWIEVGAESSQASDVLEALRPSCGADLTPEMVTDLLTPDQEPQGKSYGDGRIRLASSCWITTRRAQQGMKRGIATGAAGDLLVTPIEMLAGDGWLVTCWHPTRAFSDGQSGLVDPNPPKPDCEAGPRRRWAKGTYESAADLGTLILHELVLSYGDALHTIEEWLEDWELSFHDSVTLTDSVSEQIAELTRQRDELLQLWRSMAVLRSWVKPQNKVGLKEDPERAWMVPANGDLVHQTDDRIDRVLVGLHELAKTLRASFSLLHFEQLEEQRDRREELMRRIEIVAAAFLIPTLIVGFYGANTWLPGRDTESGFWAMVGVLLLFSLAGVGLVLLWQRGRVDGSSDDSETSGQQSPVPPDRL